MHHKIIILIFLLAALAFNANAQRRLQPSSQFQKAPGNSPNFILLSDNQGKYQHVDYNLAPWANGGSGNELVFAHESDVNPDSTCAPSLAEIGLWNSLESPPHEDAVVFYNCTDDSTQAATYVYYIDTAGVVILLESPDLTYNTTRRPIPSPAFANAQAPTEAEVWAYIQLISPPAKPGTLFVQGQGAIPMAQSFDNPATCWFYDGQHVTRIKDFPRKVEIPDNAFADTLNQTVSEVYTWLGIDSTFKGNYWLLYNIGAGTRDNPDWVYSVNGDYSPSFSDIVCIKKPSTGGGNGGTIFTTTSATNATISPNTTPKNGDVLLNLVRGSKWQRVSGAWVRVTNDNGNEVLAANAIPVTSTGIPPVFTANCNNGNKYTLTGVGDFGLGQPLNLSSQDVGEIFCYQIYNSTEDHVLVSFDTLTFYSFRSGKKMPQIELLQYEKKELTFKVVKFGEFVALQSMEADSIYYPAGGGGGGANLSLSGASSPYNLNIDTGTDVQFEQGANTTITRTGNKLTFSSAGNGTVTSINDQSNGLDISAPGGAIQIGYDFSELATVSTYDPLDNLLILDNTDGQYKNILAGNYFGNGFVTLNTVQTIVNDKNFTEKLWQGTAALPTGSKFGSTENTATSLKGGTGDVSESNFQNFGGLVIKTVYDGGTGDNTVKVIATGSDTGNDASQFKFYTRDNQLSSNWVQGLHLYNTPSQTVANFGNATSAPSGNVNVPSLGLEGLFSHYLFRSENSGTQTLCLYENTGSLVAYMQAGQTGWKDPSDRRLKKRIKTLSVLDKIGDQRAVTYTLKASGQRQIGVIAQEIEKAFPEVVGTNEDTGLKGVSYGAVGAIAYGGVVELKHENDQLKSLLAELTERIEALETGVPVKVKRMKKHKFLFFGKR